MHTISAIKSWTTLPIELVYQILYHLPVDDLVRLQEKQTPTDRVVIDELFWMNKTQVECGEATISWDEISPQRNYLLNREARGCEARGCEAKGRSLFGSYSTFIDLMKVSRQDHQELLHIDTEDAMTLFNPDYPHQGSYFQLTLYLHDEYNTGEVMAQTIFEFIDKYYIRTVPEKSHRRIAIISQYVNAPLTKWWLNFIKSEHPQCFLSSLREIITSTVIDLDPGVDRHGDTIADKLHKVYLWLSALNDFSEFRDITDRTLCIYLEKRLWRLTGCDLEADYSRSELLFILKVLLSHPQVRRVIDLQYVINFERALTGRGDPRDGPIIGMLKSYVSSSEE